MMAVKFQKKVPWVVLIALFVHIQVISSYVITNDLGKPNVPKFPISLGAADFKCPSAGLFPHETLCQAYYKCSSDGSSELLDCGAIVDILFNTDSMSCKYARETHCWDRIRPEGIEGTLEPPITTIPATTVISTTVKSTTALITSTTTTSKPTSTSTRQPTTASTSQSTSTSTSRPTTTSTEDCYNCTANGAFPHPKYCAWYFDCWEGHSTLLVCPPNPEGQMQLFDVEFFGCKVAVETDCGDRIRPTPEFLCPNNDDVYYTDPYNCAGFYRCVDGWSTYYLCPDGLLFNPELDVCDHPSNVSCSDRRQIN